jgi:hypothetical protein
VLGERALVVERHLPATEIGEPGSEVLMGPVQRRTVRHGADARPAADANGRGSGSFGLPEVDDLDRSRDACRSRLVVEVLRCLQPVLDEKVEVVPLVEDLAVDLGVHLLEEPHLAVLLGDELLVHRRDLDEEILVGDVEVGGEVLDGLTSLVVFDRERGRLVLPIESVEVEESGELTLAVVSESDLVGWGREVDGQVMPPCVRL